MKSSVVKVSVIDIKDTSTAINELRFVDDRGGYFVDDSYGRGGIPVGKVVTVATGDKLGDADSRTLFIADKDKIAVGSGDVTAGSYPYGIVWISSVKDMYDPIMSDDLRVLRPKQFQKDQLPELRYGVFYVHGFDANGNQVPFPFEKEDIDKALYLGTNGEIAVEKPATGYDKPIGKVLSGNTIMFDVENRYFAVRQDAIVKH